MAKDCPEKNQRYRSKSSSQKLDNYRAELKELSEHQLNFEKLQSLQESEMHNMNETGKELQIKCSNMDSQMKSLRTERSRIEGELKVLRSQVTILKSKLAMNQGRYDSERNKLNNLVSKNREIHERRCEIEKFIQDAESEIPFFQKFNHSKFLDSTRDHEVKREEDEVERNRISALSETILSNDGRCPNGTAQLQQSPVQGAQIDEEEHINERIAGIDDSVLSEHVEITTALTSVAPQDSEHTSIPTTIQGPQLNTTNPVAVPCDIDQSINQIQPETEQKPSEVSNTNSVVKDQTTEETPGVIIKIEKSNQEGIGFLEQEQHNKMDKGGCVLSDTDYKAMVRYGPMLKRVEQMRAERSRSTRKPSLESNDEDGDNSRDSDASLESESNSETEPSRKKRKLVSG